MAGVVAVVAGLASGHFLWAVLGPVAMAVPRSVARFDHLAMARRIRAGQPSIRELFVTPPDEVRTWPKGAHQKASWSQLFGALDAVLKASGYTELRAATR